ncbi:Clp protease ClpP [Clostridium pasteurianum]|uniref:head maturation protease, ClpP-related n=1 Tax=Clostridium pasteurianum TaxID=1501 RepID=UPI002260F366|nr:head maturation protease, ClpP-related [Clostridium pasteurianum]UZW13200.1 Clp protease ClpP [Clostridium pasteurianum]
MKTKAKNKKYWEFKNQTADSADLYLYIEIASWGGGYAAHSAQSFKDELDALGEISTLNVYINSPGGDVFEGSAIYNMLKRYNAQVNVHVDGIAASISSVIAMAGDNIIMPSNTMMMIHNAWTYTQGNADELRKAADTLDKVNKSLMQAYLDKAGDKLNEEDLKTLMDNTSWLTAQECLDYGLCDVVGEAVSISACADAELFTQYKNIPKELLNSIKPKNTKSSDEEVKTLIARVNNTLKYEEARINENE